MNSILVLVTTFGGTVLEGYPTPKETDIIDTPAHAAMEIFQRNYGQPSDQLWNGQLFEVNLDDLTVAPVAIPAINFT